VLIEMGIAAGRIRTVSLGARRPLEFSAGAAAALVNQRVEVPIEDGKADTGQVTDRILPRCRG
jgi:outer membrane protein OmpA-like peptidoglycan-associated protein